PVTVSDPFTKAVGQPMWPNEPAHLHRLLRRAVVWKSLPAVGVRCSVWFGPGCPMVVRVIRTFVASELLVHCHADVAETLPVQALVVRHMGTEALGVAQRCLVDRPTSRDEPATEVTEPVVRADAVVHVPCFMPVAILSPVYQVVEDPGE